MLFMNSVFFAKEGERGLTSTEGNYLCNIAKELQEAAAERLNNLRFFNTSVAVIGSDNKQLMNAGVNTLENIEADLQEQAFMFSFCAWVREAIKAKEDLQTKIIKMSIEDWVDAQGIEFPKTPKMPESPKTFEEHDVIDSWDINKRNHYLEIETYATHYGKLIHPNGAFNKARKNLHDAVNNPILQSGAGRDMILYYREPSVSVESVDSEFLRIQELYRKYEKELNFMKAEIKETVNELNRKSNDDYKKKIDAYRAECKDYEAAYLEIRTKFIDWKANELESISKLKIVIPTSLKPAFDKVREVSSK